jgi:(S)-ureidoglycine aminohydrolase
MNPTYLLLLLLLPFNPSIQEQTISAGVYQWPSMSESKDKSVTTVMLSGNAYDLSHLEVIAQQLAPGKKSRVKVDTEEQLLLIKAGTLTITLNDSIFSLGKGSIAMMMPGEKYSLQNNGPAGCQFHVMKYKSKLPVDLARGQSSGGSFIKDGNKLTFRPHERGGVRSYFDRPTAMTKRFEMHVTTLKGNFKSHDPHQHRAEEIILVLEGSVEMLIGENSYKAGAGDVLFAPTNVFHGLKNSGDVPCSYFAFQWE